MRVKTRRAPFAVGSARDVRGDGNAAHALGGQLVCHGLCLVLLDVDDCDGGAGLAESVRIGAADALTCPCTPTRKASVTFCRERLGCICFLSEGSAVFEKVWKSDDERECTAVALSHNMKKAAPPASFSIPF